KGSGLIEVELDTVSLPHARDLSHGRLQAGRYVRLQVSDNGPGIEPTVMDRIFEPFFTTRLAGGGTGLGLSTVHGIVTTHHGAIDVKSKPAEGATFSVYFPQLEAAAHPVMNHEGSISQGHGQTILIVED